jgi:hypothetical protein
MSRDFGRPYDDERDDTLPEDSPLENSLQEKVIKGTAKVKTKPEKDTFSCLIEKQMKLLQEMKEMMASQKGGGININIHPEPEPEPEIFSVFTGKIKKEKK